MRLKLRLTKDNCVEIGCGQKENFCGQKKIHHLWLMIIIIRAKSRWPDDGHQFVEG